MRCVRSITGIFDITAQWVRLMKNIVLHGSNVSHGHEDGETDKARSYMEGEFKCTGPDGKGCPHGVESDKLHKPRGIELKLCDDCYREYRKKEKAHG